MEEDSEPHSCEMVTKLVTKPHIDLTDISISNPDLVYYIDGSAPQNDRGQPKAAYAVVTQYNIVETASLPDSFSAQQAELFALTRACIFTQGQTVMTKNWV